MSNIERKIEVSRIDAELAHRIPYKIARKHNLLPVFAADSRIVVITPDGRSDHVWIDEIGEAIGERLIPFELKEYPIDLVEKAIEEFYGEHRSRLGELLVQNGSISEKQLADALRRQGRMPRRKIGEILKDLGYVEDIEIQKAFAEQIGYQFFSTSASLFIDVSLLEKAPRNMILENKVLPMPNREDDGEVFLLTAGKLDKKVLKKFKKILDAGSVEPLLTTESDLAEAINSCFQCLQSIKAGEKLLGDLLVEKKLISKERLVEIIKKQKERRLKLGELLVAEGILPERTIFRVLAEKLGVDFLTDLPAETPPEFRDILTEKFAIFNKLAPVGWEKNKLVVAMVEPQDKYLVSMLRQALKCDIKPVLASNRLIMEAIRRLYHPGSNIYSESERIDLKKKVELLSSGFDDSRSNTARIISMVNNILLDGVIKEASDIHITPKEDAVHLFYRMDGSLVRVEELPIRDRDNIITRIKIMSDMRIDNRHTPQGGRIVAKVDGRHIDYRVSTLPSQFGENVVLRILDSRKLLDSDLSRLGMPATIIDSFLGRCERSQGIVLVTGPTGSGKTTTLYHTLNWLHNSSPNKSISTIENPIEYVVDGILQSEVNDARGLSYFSILKEKLRQDPDIIMVGEIRNLEEGQLAFTAALTGHLVLSTLHTNDGATTLRRLVEMGLEPYNVSTAINCILSQRLARRICQHCITDHTPTEREIRRIQRTYPDFRLGQQTFKIGLGCELCNNGYKGRIGVYELLMIDAEIKSLISENATDSKIRDASVEQGMKTLRMAGLDLAFEGITTLEEVFSVTDIMH